MSYEEQIMSVDKYPSIFSRQMEAIVVIILQIFSAISKIGEYLKGHCHAIWQLYKKLEGVFTSIEFQN